MLPRGPVDDVVQVEYLDRDGDWQTLSATAYSLEDDFLFASMDFRSFPTCCAGTRLSDSS